jgi:hypothetical protein
MIGLKSCILRRQETGLHYRLDVGRHKSKLFRLTYKRIICVVDDRLNVEKVIQH